MNQWIGIGRLTADPEMTRTQNGTAIAKATIAVDRGYKNPDGSRTADFIDIKAWGVLAEILCKYMSKGRKVAVRGEYRVEPFTKQNGQKKKHHYIKCDVIEFVDSTVNNPKPGDITGGSFVPLRDDDADLPWGNDDAEPPSQPAQDRYNAQLAWPGAATDDFDELPM